MSATNSQEANEQNVPDPTNLGTTPSPGRELPKAPPASLHTLRPRSLTFKIGMALLVLTGAVLVGGIVYTIIIASSLYSFLFTQPDNVRQKVDHAYSAVTLPQHFALQSKTELGDPVDSPQEIGDEYTYVVDDKISVNDITNTLEKVLDKEGFAVQSGDGTDNSPLIENNNKLNLSLSVIVVSGRVVVDTSQLN